MSIEVADLRKGDRFTFVDPVAGTYGPVDVVLVDISLAGAQLLHPQPVRIGTTARIQVQYRDVTINTQALILWSHLVKTEKGLVYRSGLRIQADPAFAAAVNALYKSGAVKRDAHSLERKRLREEERERQRTGKLKVIPPTAGGIQ